MNKHSDKSFSFLSADEIEKLKQENEKKIATITRETKKKFASSTTAASDNINNNDQFDINDNEDEFYHNKNLIISQHEVDEDEDANVRWVIIDASINFLQRFWLGGAKFNFIENRLAMEGECIGCVTGLGGFRSFRESFKSFSLMIFSGAFP